MNAICLNGTIWYHLMILTNFSSIPKKYQASADGVVVNSHATNRYSLIDVIKTIARANNSTARNVDRIDVETKIDWLSYCIAKNDVYWLVSSLIIQAFGDKIDAQRSMLLINKQMNKI